MSQVGVFPWVNPTCPSKNKISGEPIAVEYCQKLPGPNLRLTEFFFFGSASTRKANFMLGLGLCFFVSVTVSNSRGLHSGDPSWWLRGRPGQPEPRSVVAQARVRLTARSWKEGGKAVERAWFIIDVRRLRLRWHLTYVTCVRVVHDELLL